jgi:hypothetical protein
MKINQIITENYNSEYDDEAGMAQTNLHTIARAAQGLLDTIDDQENLPEWVQEKIAKVEGMMVTAWDYLRSQEEQGMDPRMMEAANAAQQAAIAISMKKAGKKPKSQVNELAPDAGGGGSGNYFQALASAWYNHDISMLADIARKGGSPMKKITDAQEAVEKMLQRGVIGSDGKTRKYDITYNSDFDGVVIQSKDYYEYSDYDAAGNEVDSRNGRPWGPNDYMEFGGDDLDEGMYEANPELTEEFDLIESIIERLARHNGVDAEVIWEDLETLTEDELYAFAVTSEPIMEDWQKANKRDRTAGMSQKAVNAYRRENPGSKLKTAVTTKPSKLKRGSKASKRRKSYCSRSRGQMKMHSISCSKTPDKAICKARRRWNC